ncbi:MAG: hypothetical protein OXU98_10880 [Gammaproteobacteria bacterium]|nr:hypothetical protein [Gammaproteobacteria bacterium]
MSDELFIIVVTAAMLVSVVVIVIAQHAPTQLWYAWQTTFDLGKLIGYSGQIGVITIAAGIGHIVLNDGSVGEAITMNAIGIVLIVLGSAKTGGISP